MTSIPLPPEPDMDWIATIQQGKYVGCSAWVMFIWDYVISLDQEVDYIWRGRIKSSNAKYLFLRYTSLVLFTLETFMTLQTDELCVVYMHITLWPQLVINALAEYVLAARVVVIWENSKWALCAVTTAWVGVFGGILILFTLGAPGYSQAKSISVGLGLYVCTADTQRSPEIWKMWLQCTTQSPSPY